MKKALITVLLCLSAVFIAGNAMAMWSFDISDTDNDAIYELRFLSDQGNVSIDSFSLGFGWDESELAATDFSYNWPPGYSNINPVDYFVPGEITDITGQTSGGALSPGTLLATFNFDLISPLQLQDGMPDFFFLDWGLAENNNFYVTIGGTTYLMEDLLPAGNLTYGANVDKGATAPLPGALLLLGSGLVGLVGLRRKTMS